MKSKTIVWMYLVVLSIGTILSLYIPKNDVTAASEEVVIPGEAIRLRILANSDTGSDQDLKRLVRDKVNENISLWVKDLTSVASARKVIRSKLPEIQKIAENVVAQQKANQTVKIKFGKVQFPTKLYGEFLYPAGEYEAILITLGEGKGANWWCVLYPPLCFLDFSNGVAVSNGFEGEKKSDAPKKVESEKDGNENQLNQKVEKEKDRNENQLNQTEQKNPADKKEEAVSPDQNNPQVEIEKDKEAKQQAPVYTSEDEKPIKVKFFVVELWQKLFD
ncbi:MAG: stage II sporulation protein R [Bacillota bacterium]|nr:stage II sporulation protein R [Bacillota bacterium]